MGQLIVQVAARSARSPEITKSDGRPLSVGRAFGNDIVLADPFVAPQQLTLACADDTWVVSVLDRTNEVLINGVPIAGDSAALRSGDRITVGRTDLMIYAADHPLDPTRKLLLSAWITPGRVGPVLAFGVLASVCVIDMGLEFMQTSIDLKWKNFAYGALFYAAVLVVWAGSWAVTGRVLRHQPHFFVQLLATSLVGVGFSFIFPLAAYLEFFASSVTVNRVAAYLMGLGTLTVLLKLNLFFATNIRNTSLAAFVISCVIVGLTFAANRFGVEDFEAEPVYSKVVKPPFAHIGTDRSIDELLAAVVREADKP